MNGVIAFAFWSSTFLNPDAPILEGLTVREVPGFMQLGVSSVHFQKETIGSELAFYNGENYAFGPLQPFLSASITNDGGAWLGYGFVNSIEVSDQFGFKFKFAPGAYMAGQEVDLGGWLMFKSGIELEYSLSDWKFSVGYDHRSSGDIWEYNPGMETLQLSVSKKK